VEAPEAIAAKASAEEAALLKVGLNVMQLSCSWQPESIVQSLPTTSVSCLLLLMPARATVRAWPLLSAVDLT